MKIKEKFNAISKRRKIVSIILIIAILTVLLTIFLSAYLWWFLPLEPEVVVIDETYNATTIHETINSDRPIFKAFEKEYGGKCSPELRRSIIGNMKSQAASLGKDPETLEKCFYANEEYNNDDFHAIPCLAVKARFEYYENYLGQNPNPKDYPPDFDFGPKVNESCWVFLVNWGSNNENFGHICMYVMSIETQEQLYYMSCM